MGKRILMLLSNEFRPDPRVGKEASSLISADNTVTILSWDRENRYPRKETIDGISVERIKLRSIHDMPYLNVFLLPLFWIISFFEILASDWDVVHCHDFDTIIPGIFAGKIKKIPVIYDAHEDYPGMWEGKLPTPLVNGMYFIDKIMAKNSSKLITVNRLLKERFESYGASVEIVMNCQRFEEYELPQKEVKRVRKKINPKDKFLILYIGGLTEDRGLETIITAIDSVKKSLGDNCPILWLYGKGPFEGTLKDMVERLSLGEDIKFGGYLEYSQVPLYNKASDLLFALYSKKTANNRVASPNKLFDAMVSGKPIIVSDTGILSEVVKGEKMGIVVKDEYKSVASGIRRLIQDLNMYGELSQNAKKASLRYNWGAEERGLLKTYKELE
jgi:glycosyltransferase involved in cell wall biosynthesis